MIRLEILIMGKLLCFIMLLIRKNYLLFQQLKSIFIFFYIYNIFCYIYKGPAHDFAWNPNSEDFMIISGYMPAKPVLYTSKCEPIF